MRHAMTDQTAEFPDLQAEIQWRAWQARGAETDRRTATRMHRLTLVVVTAFAVWFFVQLA
jgi:hypothetical protein